MTMERLDHYLKLISDHGEIEGFTLAEYLPFDEYRLSQVLETVSIFEN